MADVSVKSAGTRRGRAAAVALAVAMVGACSGGGGAGTQSSSTQAAASSATQTNTQSSAATVSSGASTASARSLHVTTDDACALVTQAQADALVGSPTRPIPPESANLAAATDDQMKSIAINAPGSAVTLSICGYSDPARPDVGFGVSLYSLASGSTGTFPPAAYYEDVSSRFGLPAVQHNSNGVSAQVGWTHAVIDTTHILLITAKQNPELCLRVMDQVLANLR